MRAPPADACYASGWRDKLESMLYGVTDAANLSIVLTDGPYGGGVCGATNHSHHVRSSMTFQHDPLMESATQYGCTHARTHARTRARAYTDT